MSLNINSPLVLGAFVIVAAFVILNPWLLIIIGMIAAFSYCQATISSAERAANADNTESDDPFAKNKPFTVEAHEVEDKH